MAPHTVLTDVSVVQFVDVLTRALLLLTWVGAAAYATFAARRMFRD
ncbi:MAG: hypothetical protein P4L64_16285 [Caulobacteraceae bacterium]|nr:hypothetical protein [Caulobacteraceae bacterium]